MTRKAERDAIKIKNGLRQIFRTDLLKLCQLLGYNDVTEKVHGPILKVLQKFPGGFDKEVAAGKWEYKPAAELWQLTGKRQTLILYPRGHLKTTLISQAHLIQWIINYPNIRILLSCYTGDQVENVIRKVKGIFQYNEYFRMLFPEFCPPAMKASDWGTKDQFLTPARTMVRGEPTVFSVTVGKTIAGYHPDVIFHSDLVDKENVKTPGGIKDVISHFHYMNPLLERYNAQEGYAATRGWVYVEGTPYDFGDLHTELYENSNGWEKVVESADPQDRADDKPLWPERFPVEELKNIEKEIGAWMYSAQYRMKCIPPTDGLCDPRDVVFVPRDVIGSLLPRLRLHVTIDLHGMEQSKSSDFTVLTLGGFDRDGRLYIVDIKQGRYTPEEVINMIFDLHKGYPQIIDFKIEKDAHARVLLPFLQREMSKRQKFPTIWPIKRDTQTSKKHRIRGLRPWFKSKIIVFSEGIPTSVQTELLHEVARFPSEAPGVHDDILDTLADQMQNQEGGLNVDVIADPPDMKFSAFGVQRPRDKFLGFGENGVSQWLYGNDERVSEQREAMTGVL
jgi:predicted phage terminase large subunit-like protein